MTHPNAFELEAYACGEASEPVREHLGQCEACASFVSRAQTFVAAETPTLKSRPPRRVIPWSGLYVAAPMAAAAALLLWMRPTGSPATLTESHVTSPSETTFKGAVQVAVIRERGSDQVRFTGPTRVRRDDRLRLEVALDQEQAILGGVLADDGTFLELMTQAVRGHGTHFSEQSARIDGAPVAGVVIVGTPDAVARARKTRNLSGVRTLRIEPESP